MSTIYCKSDIARTLESYISEYESKIQLWKKVKRVYKKDGSNFKVLSKNFENAKIQNKTYSSYEDPEMIVSDWTQSAGYISDSIDLRELVKYSSLKPDEDRIIKVPYLEPYFFLTVDEIEKKIAATIKLYETHIEEYKKQLAICDKTYDQFKSAIDNALSDLRKSAGNNTSLYYMCRDYMKRAY